ncbi:aldose 1-epimerase family protein [Couchioplanes caeruleus]|uniref:Aldose epimerase n=2 Tax=Couchioplanes caeruleus TaxID=56438 RepID=A0A1K0FIA2_9ACTN|nr:aldose 1-epimerase family protein [Couchioplanes caeruleus]OJF12553.1 aldose epimerase [Couchioplanes caeruleus subsp. caeruleus]ROP30622.1 aldose 1-epimerase [Couchioplanes caeruleus]
MSAVVSARSGTQWTIEAGGHRATLAEVGGVLRGYAVGAVEVVDGFGPDEISPASAGQLLAPWPNRIRDGRYTFEGTSYQLPLTEPGKHNAIHGLANWARWRLADRTPDSVTLEFELPAQIGYPWPLTLRTRWSVGAEGLRSDQEVVNTGDANAPWGFSVHPYLRLPGVAVDDILLRVPGRTKVLTDARLLPIGAVKVAGGEFDFTAPRRIGAAKLDTTWGDVITEADGGSSVTIAAPDGSQAVTVWGDESFKWWQVFTGDTLSGERFRRSLAIEPMTCPPDAFRSGRDLVVLAPGQAWQASWGIRKAG